MKKLDLAAYKVVELEQPLVVEISGGVSWIWDAIGYLLIQPAIVSKNVGEYGQHVLSK